MKMMLLALVVIAGTAVLANFVLDMYSVPASVAFATKGARVGAVE